MTGGERVSAYINSLYPGNSEQLDRMEADAKASKVPIIRKETQSLLRFLIKAHSPEKILEVGTAVGFSALFMSEYAPEGCRITTIENYEKRIPVARANFKAAGREGQITLLEGDAAKLLPTIEGAFGFIFLDAAKGQYISFLPQLLRLLADRGILVADNVLKEGEIIESRFAVTRRNRTIHKRMREYLYEVTHHESLVSTVLPVGDGLAVSYKK